MGWYTLMSKSYKLVDVEISDMGEMISTGTIYDRSRLNPSCESGLLEDIYKWWESRCIPSSRKHLKDIERNLGITNIKYLAKVAYGASRRLSFSRAFTGTEPLSESVSVLPWE